MDLSEDFTVAASNVITTLAFRKEVSGKEEVKAVSVSLEEVKRLPLCCLVRQELTRTAAAAQLLERDRGSVGFVLDLCPGLLPAAQGQ